ncbi:hypothetical protein [Sphingobium sp. CR28]|uniref:hypothetical protein n=1 Tax=Sphingobium sp. CR28 TaxID=3400272 RepID=UPI003FF007A5
MTTSDYQWGLSNPGPESLLVWLEPWCDEFEVPARSTITLKAPGGFEEGAPGEVEWTPKNLVIWGNGPTVEVFIDGVHHESGSAVIPIPDGLTKKMLNVVFAEQPTARLGGAPSTVIDWTSRWRRVRHILGL